VGNNCKKVSASGYLCSAIFHADNSGTLTNIERSRAHQKSLIAELTHICRVGWVEPKRNPTPSISMLQGSGYANETGDGYI
jgi:hypothetical protein